MPHQAVNAICPSGDFHAAILKRLPDFRHVSGRSDERMGNIELGMYLHGGPLVA